MFPPVVAPIPEAALSERELVARRLFSASRERVYRAWTAQFPLWWGPHGVTTPACELDLRPGGVFRTVMRAPNGAEYPTRGVFLEVVENERIVFTDAFGPGWAPSEAIFFTAVVSFDAVARHLTRCTAQARHWSVEDCRRHEQLGFHLGWAESFDRLSALVRTAHGSGSC